MRDRGEYSKRRTFAQAFARKKSIQVNQALREVNEDLHLRLYDQRLGPVFMW